MALKFVKLDEAARMLGLTVDEINAMRERHELHGYRDGATWKFKETDIERVRSDLAERREAEPGVPFNLRETVDELNVESPAEAPAESAPAGERASRDSGELIDLPVEMDAESDEVVLLSEVELGESDPTTSSTIIGKPGQQRPDESDIKIITDEERDGTPAGGSDVRLVSTPEASPHESGVKLVVSDEAKTPPSSIGQETVEPDAPTEIRAQADDEDSVDLGMPDSELAGSDIALGSDVIGRSVEDELSLGDDAFDLADASSSIADEKDDSSSEVVTADDDSDFVLRSPSSSDITLGTGDSGISLADPADSGLSLEDPIEIGSVDEESLELGGDALMSLDDDSDSQEVQELAGGEEFMLEPMQEIEDDESSGSGSQTIDLDTADEDPFAELGSTESPLAEDEGVFEEEPQETVALAAEGVAVRAGYPTAEFSALSVVSLGVCATLVALGGVMMFDLIRNMWSWDTPYSLNSTLMDTVLGLFEG